MNSKQIFIATLKNIIILFLIFSVLKQLNILKIIEITSDLTITDLVAVLGIIIFTAGSTFFLGAHLKDKKNYHLKRLEFSFKDQILIVGGIYVSYILIAIFVIFILNDTNKIPLFIVAVIFYVFILSSGYSSTEKYEIVTLKMLAFNENGSQKLEIRENLELYDTTDKDYWFKDFNGNEFIIPNNQVIEIIYLDKPNKDEEKQ